MMIEDILFKLLLDNLRISLTKKKYIKATYSHKCSLCLDEDSKETYKLKPQYRIIDDNYMEITSPTNETVPYLFICAQCYEELPEDDNI